MTVVECKLGSTDGVGVLKLKFGSAGTENTVSTAALSVSQSWFQLCSCFGAPLYPSIGGPRYTIDTSVLP